MENPHPGAISMFRFVAAFLAVKVIAGIGLALYAHIAETEPSISHVPITIAAVGAALLWYSKVAGRPMSGPEILKFSIGNTLADILMSAAWLFVMMWVASAPLSWEGVAIALGGKVDAKSAQLALTIGLLVGSFQVFALSAFFAWLTTRKLPRTARQA